MGKHSIRKISTFSIAATSVAATAALVAAPATASAATWQLPGSTVINTTPSTITVDSPYFGGVGGSFVQNALGSILGLGATNALLGQYGTQVVVSPVGMVTVNGVALDTPLGNAIVQGVLSPAGGSWTTIASGIPLVNSVGSSLNVSPSGVGGSLALNPLFIGPVALTGSAGLNGVSVGASAFGEQVGFAVTPDGVAVTLPVLGTVTSQQVAALVAMGVQSIIVNGITLPLPGGSAHLGLGGVTYNTGVFSFGSNGSLSPNGGSLGASTPWGSGSGAIDVGPDSVTTSLDGDVNTPLMDGSTSSQAGFGLSGVEAETDTNVELTTPVGGSEASVGGQGIVSQDGVSGSGSGDVDGTITTPVGDIDADGGVSGSGSADSDGVSGSGSGDLDIELTTPVGDADVDASTDADGSADSDDASGGADASGGVGLG